MKLSLVVAQGVHQGKVIPIAGTQFIIGRDPQCNLRPASPAVSKQHCSLTVRDGKVFVRDIGSTNGTFVNEEQVAGDKEILDNDTLKVGPLEFVLKIELGVGSKGKLAAIPPAAEVAPAETAKPEVKVAASPKPAPAKPAVAQTAEEDADQLAAMMLAEDGGDIPDGTASQAVPDGTTVMEIPAIGSDTKEVKPKPANPNTADTSGAAAAILSKYMRRPRT